MQADPDGYYEVLVAPGARTVTAHADGMAPGSQLCNVVAGGYTQCFVALAAMVGGEAISTGSPLRSESQ